MTNVDDNITTPRIKDDSARFGREFFPPIAAIVLLGILSFYSLQNIRKSEIESLQANRALGLVEQILQDLLDAETGQRGYLLTGDVAYLEPYHQARGNYGKHFVEAQELIPAESVNKTLEEVRRAAVIQFERWAESIQSQANGDTESALSWLISGQSKRTMDEIRDQLNEVEVAIRAKVSEADRHSAAAFFNAIVTFAAALIMTLGASVWSFLRVDRELQRRRLGEEIIRHRTIQLQSFADVVARIFSARDVESIIGVALNEFRQLIGAREALLRLSASRNVRYERGVVATGNQQPTAEYLSGVFELAELVGEGEATFCRSRSQVRSLEKLVHSPRWAHCGESFDGILSSPLRDSTRREIGRIVLLGKFGGEFSDHDCLLVSQLAYSVSVAIENAQLTAAMSYEANRKDEFLAMLGHELRNPLAGVLTGAEALMQLDGGTQPSQTDDSHSLKDSILRQARMMSRIVDDLLDVSRIARGKITLAITTIDLRKLVLQTVADYRLHYPSRIFDISISADQDHYIVSGDPTRITQSLSNLLHNACKFSPENEPVTINLGVTSQDRPFAKIDIIDHGVGLTPDEQRVVCDLFEQTHATIDRSEGGLGIGLTLAKGLIEMHGGQLTVTSPGRNLGSSFTIRLPLRHASELTSDQLDSVAAVKKSVFALPPPEARNNRHKEHASKAPTPKRVLVIDDRIDAILPIRVILKREGHEVFEAHDGVSGVALAAQVTPDVVLCDIGLPGKWNGYDVVKELRLQPATCDALIVALSGYSQPSDRQRAKEAGFDLHLAKPIDGKRLRELVHCDRHQDLLF